MAYQAYKLTRNDLTAIRALLDGARVPRHCIKNVAERVNLDSDADREWAETSYNYNLFEDHDLVDNILPLREIGGLVVELNGFGDLALDLWIYDRSYELRGQIVVLRHASGEWSIQDNFFV